MRIVFVQWGNYAEAHRRLAAGRGETFFGQRYTVEYVSGLARRAEDVCQICISEALPEETLDDGVRQLGLRLHPPGGRPRVRELVRLTLAQRPTHLIPNTPLVPLIRAARRAGVDVLPLLADSFRAPGWRARLRYARLAHELRQPAIRWVSNHNVSASRDLERIGVPAEKIVPFDWPPLVRPEDFPPKPAAADPQAPRLLYVGQVTVDKGVGDLVEGLARLVSAGRDARLTIVGVGADRERLEARAAALGLHGRVTFAGRRPHEEIVPTMQAHDVVLVPSRHAYPEGLPMVLYEGLCSRTPLVVSDHPMFASRVRHGRDGLVFPAGDAAALAEQVTRLLDDPALYAALSRDVEEACRGFVIGAPWAELLDHWLGGTPEDDAWLSAHALASPRYR